MELIENNDRIQESKAHPENVSNSRGIEEDYIEEEEGTEEAVGKAVKEEGGDSKLENKKEQERCPTMSPRNSAKTNAKAQRNSMAQGQVRIKEWSEKENQSLIKEQYRVQCPRSNIN